MHTDSSFSVNRFSSLIIVLRQQNQSVHKQICKEPTLPYVPADSASMLSKICLTFSGVVGAWTLLGDVASTAARAHLLASCAFLKFTVSIQGQCILYMRTIKPKTLQFTSSYWIVGDNIILRSVTSLMCEEMHALWASFIVVPVTVFTLRADVWNSTTHGYHIKIFLSNVSFLLSNSTPLVHPHPRCPGHDIILHSSHGEHRCSQEAAPQPSHQQTSHATVFLWHHTHRTHHQPLLQGHLRHRWGPARHRAHVTGNRLRFSLHHDCYHFQHAHLCCCHSAPGFHILFCPGTT